jgi:hypothetical protein
MLCITCPSCGKTSRPEEAMFGRMVKCLACGHEFMCDRNLAKQSTAESDIGSFAIVIVIIMIVLIGLLVGYVYYINHPFRLPNFGLIHTSTAYVSAPNFDPSYRS